MPKANQSNNQHNEVTSSILKESGNYVGFANQLSALGLKLRDIPGDGNCLFRALADQLEGHSKNHRRYRMDTVRYMREHRCDFEPFVEDDCSFDDHVYKLGEDGTYAGNDAIVAFARRNAVNVVIHQLNAPMWTINGSDRTNIPQLHIAYHNGDHYSSVRKLNDNSDNPAAIKLMTKAEKKQQSSVKRESKRKQISPPASVKKQIQHISNVTGCQDSKLIFQLLDENGYDVDGVIGLVLQILSSPVASEDDSNESTYNAHSSKSNTGTHPNLWDSSGTGSRIFGSQNVKTKQQESRKKITTPPKKLSNKRRKEELKKERKKRSEEKKRNGGATSQSNLSDSDDSAIILKNMEILKM